MAGFFYRVTSPVRQPQQPASRYKEKQALNIQQPGTTVSYREYSCEFKLEHARYISDSKLVGKGYPAVTGLATCVVGPMLWLGALNPMDVVFDESTKTFYNTNRVRLFNQYWISKNTSVKLDRFLKLDLANLHRPISMIFPNWPLPKVDHVYATHPDYIKEKNILLFRWLLVPLKLIPKIIARDYRESTAIFTALDIHQQRHERKLLLDQDFRHFLFESGKELERYAKDTMKELSAPGPFKLDLKRA